MHWSVLLHPDELQVASKTGRFNDALSVDDVIGVLLGPALEAGTRTFTGPQRVIGMTEGAFTKLFNQSCQDLKLTVLEAGTSADYGSTSRSLAEIKLRGRWQSNRSVQ